MLCPVERDENREPKEPTEFELNRIRNNKEKLADIRSRLSDISWWMRFSRPRNRLDYMGDVSAMFSLMFRLSEDDDRLQSRISTLVDLNPQAAEERGFRRLDQGSQRRRSGKAHTDDAIQRSPAGASRPAVRTATNPLSHLADGLVKSLAKIDAECVTPVVLQSYVAAVERVGKLPEFEIPLRLFRSGIRYLISNKESEFVELIKPERRILRQPLGLEPEE